MPQACALYILDVGKNQENFLLNTAASGLAIFVIVRIAVIHGGPSSFPIFFILFFNHRMLCTFLEPVQQIAEAVSIIFPSFAIVLGCK